MTVKKNDSLVNEEKDDKDLNPEVKDKEGRKETSEDEKEEKETSPDKKKDDSEEKVEEAYREEDQPPVITGETPEAIAAKLRESLNPLFSADATLSDDFKTKAATIFETAVMEQVRIVTEKLNAQANEVIAERVKVIKEDLSADVNRYLSYVVENWKTDNKVAIETGMRLEIAENFFAGIKKVFEESYVEVPEEKFNLLEAANAEKEELEKRLSETLSEAATLRTTIQEMKKDEAFNILAEGLTDTDKDRFATLVTEHKTLSLDDFTAKAKIVRESFFSKTSQDGKKEAEKIVENVEGAKVPGTKTEVDPAIAAALKFSASMVKA
jgi:hypothetical protein